MADFDDKIVSAVGEAFNNIPIHVYSDSRRGDVEVELESDQESLTIRLSDTGRGFDPLAKPPPDLASLPESGMGLYIVRQCVDELSYTRGVAPAPNVLTLRKRYFVPEGEEPA